MSVGCEGNRHRLLWRQGRVELLDHPELEAELAMVGLGGPEPRCVSLLRLWDDALADGGFLAEWVDETRLSPSWFSWLAMALERMRSEGFHEFLRGLPPARAQRMGEFLHSFPVPWVDRASAAVSLAVAEGSGVACDQASGLLAAGVSHRLRRAFVDGVGGRQLAVGAAALVPLRIGIESGVEPSIAGSLTGPERGVRLLVDRSWLHRVWAAGASVIDGRLVLALDEPPPTTPSTARARTRSSDPTDSISAIATLVGWAQPPGDRLQPVVERAAVRFVDRQWHVV